MCVRLTFFGPIATILFIVICISAKEILDKNVLHFLDNYACKLISDTIQRDDW